MGHALKGFGISALVGALMVLASAVLWPEPKYSWMDSRCHQVLDLLVESGGNPEIPVSIQALELMRKNGLDPEICGLHPPCDPQ